MQFQRKCTRYAGKNYFYASVRDNEFTNASFYHSIYPIIAKNIRYLGWDQGAWHSFHDPDSKVHGANMGPNWVMSAPDGPMLALYEPCYQGTHQVSSAPIRKCNLSEVWVEIAYPFPNFNGWTVEVWEWISNFSPNIIKDVITYPSWDYT